MKEFHKVRRVKIFWKKIAIRYYKIELLKIISYIKFIYLYKCLKFYLLHFCFILQNWNLECWIQTLVGNWKSKASNKYFSFLIKQNKDRKQIYIVRKQLKSWSLTLNSWLTLWCNIFLFLLLFWIYFVLNIRQIYSKPTRPKKKHDQYDKFLNSKSYEKIILSTTLELLEINCFKDKYT